MDTNIVSRTLSVHKEHEVLLKLEAAGLDDDLAQKIIDAKGNDLAKKLICFLIGVKKLLQFLFTFSAEAMEKFITKEKFVEGKTTDGVSTAWLGSNFKTNFLGKIEKRVEKAELKVHNLLVDARDLPKDDEPGIIPELGGKHEIKLAQFFQLLAHKQQTKDFTWIIAYIADESGVLWAVDADWSADRGGWNVFADSVGYPSGWSADRQVVSR